VVSWLVAGLLSFTGIAGTWVGFIIALLITLFIIKGVYRTGFGRAILVWIFSILAVIVFVVVFVLILVPVLGITGYNYM
jgi:heme/copper-type cytochrome/quinol oxidase subunit 4